MNERVNTVYSMLLVEDKSKTMQMTKETLQMFVKDFNFLRKITK